MPHNVPWRSDTHQPESKLGWDSVLSYKDKVEFRGKGSACGVRKGLVKEAISNRLRDSAHVHTDSLVKSSGFEM